MEHKTWRTMDKSSWGPGPWQDEPDKEQFTDEATGLSCLVKRNRGGALCGYVGVSEGHPWFRVDWAEVPAEVHGGLTYADFCEEGGDEGRTICHVPGPGEPDRVWWLGFDCAHHMDLSPGMNAELAQAGVGHSILCEGTYRTVAYVKAECASLAQQVAEVAKVDA